MVDEAGQNAKGKPMDKSSVGFTLPFAERAPTNPMEAMAAATAAGVALSTQFATAFFGMMQAAMGTTGPAPAPQPAPAKTPAPEKAPAPVAVEPVAKAEVSAPDVAKPQAVKPVKPAKAKAAPVAVKPKAPAKTVKTAKVEPVSIVTKAPGKVAVPEVKPVAVKAAPAARKKGKAADDLKKISGIGPKLGEMLNGMGVLSFKDIAGWSEDDVVHFDQELGLDGRIAKDNWIAQAKALLR
ncbi:hypothetical protein [Rhizobium sp. FY34]|uniref:hypothetical protein n=1 Tax=Rhizobium sp. FY34 TaxID=2562309 RepID=UPI0010C07B17|nr:hypothetical protein [Rhizobium sp. FY34]